ncbi:Leucine-rich repeat protein kinase family protein [Rhynchospora pubera]|uniref:Leucine-rich repeat protein kinase family protein n=1 Tax=Rhynchospora pubera TaxID=906938 RepID=A0AAV8HQT1_9POAL|nr:Leucine-rich repeat protein kinase family protein [Rhynchospora pubera]
MAEAKGYCLFLLLTTFLLSFTSASLNADLSALLDFRSASDPFGSLWTWNRSDPSPCATWLGVTCSAGRVTRLVLEDLNLSGAGALSALSQLDGIRVISLKSNQLSGLIPDFSPLTGLKLLFLSYNNLSGPIPPTISSLHRLYRLDLSHNNLSGSVPASLNQLTRLLTLWLDSNQLTGSISGLSLPRLQDLNLSSNLLTGSVPPSLATFSISSFSNNPALCGAPLLPCRDVVSDPSRPSTPNITANAAAPVPPAAAVVTSSPSSKPEVAPPQHTERMSRAAVLAIVAGDFAVLVLVSCLLFCYFWRKFASRKHTSRLHEGEKIVYSSSPYGTAGIAAAGGGFERGKIVFLDTGEPGGEKFELEDLLRASAEMLGKGGYGTAYKAVLDDGNVVAVKRLRDIHVAGKREFEHHMEMHGRMRHQNLVPLTAYYYARDEKLLVYDFMPNGSLFSLLHGNRGPGRTPLDWSTRVRIAAGAARGLAHIHHASRSPRLAHGNVKTTNILIDKNGEPRLADYGLALLGPSIGVATRSVGYRPPEAPPAESRRPWATQKGDVYSFGVVLLELLTGKPASDCGAVDLPRWVQSVVREEWTAEVFDLELMRYKGIEEEMVALLQLAISCTAASPDQRPKMSQVVKMIDEIRVSSGGGEISPSHDSFDSISDSPSVLSEDASASTVGVANQ